MKPEEIEIRIALRLSPLGILGAPICRTGTDFHVAGIAWQFRGGQACEG
jgi:hypothetical protein